MKNLEKCRQMPLFNCADALCLPVILQPKSIEKPM